METLAQKINRFNRQLQFTGKLPRGIQVMNPFKENPEIIPVSEMFYNKFYADTAKRKFIVGINPGRLGAGATGIPFTDTKRLSEFCGINIGSFQSHEPSSVFVYDVIRKYGGVQRFYAGFYINSVCPLGFIRQNEKGNWVNCNYYDYPDLFEAVRPFIISSLKKQIGFGLDTDSCFVLGKKNAAFLEQVNGREKLFKNIIVLDHPRYIEQYRSAQRNQYINGYLKKLKGVSNDK